MKYLLFFYCLFMTNLSLGGEAKYQSICAACHGTKGISSSELYPNLACQKKGYIVKQLQDFKLNKRQNSTAMKAFAEMLSDEEIESIAQYLSKLGCN